jgi:hypothetical protein
MERSTVASIVWTSRPGSRAPKASGPSPEGEADCAIQRVLALKGADGPEYRGKTL